MAEYIDRNALLKKIMSWPIYNTDRENHVNTVNRDSIINIALTEPAANVARVKHGYWTTNKYDFDKCSACGYEQERGGWVARNFCPRCGAKMDEEVKDG